MTETPLELHLEGADALRPGLDLLGSAEGFAMSDTGISLQVTTGPAGALSAANTVTGGTITYDTPNHFFRALGLWLQHYRASNGGEFAVHETAKIAAVGVMLDCSRNAVATPATVQLFLRKMALLGMNRLMLYVEDTYTVPEYPYFGYMRGRYSQAELRALDDYADALGIEIIPCIQTLAHLKQALKWNYAQDIRDTEDILLVDEPKTYDFVRHLIEAASAPFRSKRIHLGMDEAHQLGLGRYLDKNGYHRRFDIMNAHLQKVCAITKDLGLAPMIWSDMYFKLAAHDEYYAPDAHFDPAMVAGIPDVRMVYWDYYHDDPQLYEAMLNKHRDLGKPISFAGGAWTWNGMAPNYGKAWVTTNAAMIACKKAGIDEFFATIWGDNGAETPTITSFPVLQLIAEHAYHGAPSEAVVAERFAACFHAPLATYFALKGFDEVPGVSKDNLGSSSSSKFLLYQDVLAGLYDENVRGLHLGAHYQQLDTQLANLTLPTDPTQASLFSYYRIFAHTLALKADIGIRLHDAYRAGDHAALQAISDDLAELHTRVNAQWEAHRALWYRLNSPFGWEVLDIRYGGVLARIDTAAFRLDQYLSGAITSLPEVAEPQLPYDGPYPLPEGVLGSDQYHKIVSASPLSE